MTVGDHLLEVVRLTTVNAMVVRREPELFEEIERAVDRGRGCRWVCSPHALDQFSPGRMAVGGGEHVGDQLPLLGPALAARLYRRL
jgi:hypothetical protein